MFICSNEFVQFLGQTNAGEVRSRVLRRVDEDNIRVLQISDLHRTAPSAIDPPRFQQEVQRFRAGIQEQLQIWRGRFTDPNQTMSFHGLVVSGDLINGSVIEDDVGATADQKFSCSCVENAAGVLDLTDLDRQVLVVPGNHDIYRRGASIKEKLEPFVGGAHSRFDGSSSVRAPGEGVPSIEELRLFPRLILLGNADGVLAVFGLDSNHTAYELKGLERFGLVNVVQITHLERSVEALRTLFNDRPLYVWVVLHHHLLPVEDFGTVRSQITKTEGPDKTSVINRLLVSVTLDSRDVIAALQRMRVSLVTHGHMHYPALQRVSYLTLGDGRGGGGLNIIACPSFSGNVPVGEHPPYIGAVAVTFAKNRGSTQVDVLATREESKVNSSVTLPALSTSRCSAGEMRVLKRIRAWLSRDKLAHERFVAMSGSNPDRFTSVLEKIWQEYGYTQLSALPDGVVPEQSSEFPIPDDLSVLRQKRYKLLLLLKGEDGAEPRILLNNHCAVRQSSYGTWDAPLLPAFTDVNDFLQRLRMDIYRLAENAVVEKADSSKARQRKLLRLREAQEKINAICATDPQEIESRVLWLGQRNFIKFSPSDGQPESYQYHLTVFEPLVLDKDAHDSLASVIYALPPVEEFDVFRWEPNNGEAPTGYIWFPLDRWRECPAIVARNADVMAWVDAVLAKIMEGNHGRYPDWILCGRSKEGVFNQYAIQDVVSRPFSIENEEGGERGNYPNYPKSLVEGLRAVRFGPGDLADRFAYAEPATFSSVYLRKVKDSSLEDDDSPAGCSRARIAVHSAEGEQFLGFLRPVQRYVLKTGLDRARALVEAVASVREGLDVAKLGIGDNGYLLLVTSGPDPISLLPPIIEAINPMEREDPQANEEFIVCDGNHRVVQYLWNGGKGVRLHCVLVRSPAEPYYAHSFSTRDWNVTATNVLHYPPDLYGKYTPRRFEPGAPSADPANRLWYRRYYRDFSSAFRDVGDQGGQRTR